MLPDMFFYPFRTCSGIKKTGGILEMQCESIRLLYAAMVRALNAMKTLEQIGFDAVFFVGVEGKKK